MEELRSSGAGSEQTGRGLVGPAGAAPVGAAPVGAGPPFRVYHRLVSGCRQSGNNFTILLIHHHFSSGQKIYLFLFTCDQCYKPFFGVITLLSA
jgi:hypothetical protein